MAQTEDNKVSDNRLSEENHAQANCMSIRGPAPVSRKLSFVLQQTPVEVLCHRTAGVGVMRGTENAEWVTALGGGTHQFIRAFAVPE